jgi:hypothetical protein
MRVDPCGDPMRSHPAPAARPRLLDQAKAVVREGDPWCLVTRPMPCGYAGHAARSVEGSCSVGRHPLSNQSAPVVWLVGGCRSTHGPSCPVERRPSRGSSGRIVRSNEPCRVTERRALFDQAARVARSNGDLRPAGTARVPNGSQQGSRWGTAGPRRGQAVDRMHEGPGSGHKGSKSEHMAVLDRITRARDPDA